MQCKLSALSLNLLLEKFTHMPRPTVGALPQSAKGGRKEPKSQNKHLRALHAFFKRIVDASGENADVTLRKIVKRLATSNRVRQPVKVSKVVEAIGSTGKVAVVVTKVLDDERLMTLPPVHIVALKWSRSVKKKIEENGGSISTLDCFIKVAGSLDNILMVNGDPEARKSCRFFGPPPGLRGSATRPRCNVKGKNAEKRINYRKPITFENEDD